jgi:hypothetical protein
LLAAGFAVVLAVGCASPAATEEKLVGAYGEERTVRAFKLTDATIQKLLPMEQLPMGWEAAPSSPGPAKDANLTVSFIDWLTVQKPDGRPGRPCVLWHWQCRRKGKEPARAFPQSLPA